MEWVFITAITEVVAFYNEMRLPNALIPDSSESRKFFIMVMNYATVDVHGYVLMQNCVSRLS